MFEMVSYLYFTALLLSQWTAVLGFPTTLATYELTTETVPGQTYTEIDYTSTGPSTTETFASYTVSRPDLTFTDAASTISQLVIPTEFSYLDPDIAPEVIDVVANFAPDVTSVPLSALQQLAQDLVDYDAAYTATNSAPAILTKAIDDLHAFSSASFINSALYESIRNDLFAFEPASQVSELQELVSPFPSLSSELMAYLSAAQAYEIPQVFGEGSIVSKDLSLTGAVPSYISEYTQNGLTPATATSSAGVAPTGGAVVVVNAVAAAVGMVGVALL